MNIIQLFQHKHTDTHAHRASEQVLFIRPNTYLLSSYYVPEMMSGVLITTLTSSLLSKSPEISRTNTQVNRKLQHSELLDWGMCYGGSDVRYVPQIFKMYLIHSQSRRQRQVEYVYKFTIALFFWT